jgi:hypothetical protein
MKQRIRRKIIKKSIVIIDLESIPYGMNGDEMLDLFHNTGVLVWDSTKGGVEPKIYPIKNKQTIKIKDYGKRN